ncbi:ABC transporter ATP-binding protein [Lysobacter capsici]|uniref:ABC transporter ATP-binding protein n=1 Tax=Lysobacter capsici TaxID=435897 RepID=UPI000627EEEA|nr:ABC transporter ATP-binding protein [Lysobacter capsici]
MSVILELDGLQHRYDEHAVLNGIDLRLRGGEFVALIGPNGSGKTTLLHCLAGIQQPSAGRVLIGGHDIVREPLAARRQLGFAVDPARLPPLLSGRECLRLFAGARGTGEIPAATLALAETLGCSAMLDRRIGQYSLGTRQKLAILLGLLGEPPLLVLDEPLNGLDPLSAYALKHHLQRLAAERGVAVLLATHSLDVAERFINRAVLLMDGRLRREWASDELDAIRADPARSLEQSMVEALADPEPPR